MKFRYILGLLGANLIFQVALELILLDPHHDLFHALRVLFS